MSKPKLHWWTNPSAAVRHAVAIISVGVALVAAKLLDHYWHSTPFTSLFICAVMFSGWFGGFRPGLLAIALSILAFDYYFLPPVYSLGLSWSEFPRLVLFAMASLMVGLLAASQRSNTESLEEARDHLAAKVLELNKINEALQAENVERKRVEDALRRSETYLAEAQRLSHTGSFGWKVATGEIFWSEETYRIIGHDLSFKPTLEGVFPLVHPDDVTTVREVLNSGARNGTDLDFEQRYIMPNGTMKHVHVRAHAVRDTAGNLEYAGAAMDVTQQHQAKAALEKALAEIKKSEDQLRTIVDTIPTLAWRALPDGSAEFFNQRWLDYTGLSMEEARNWGWTVAIHPEDSAKLVQIWSGILASAEPGETEARMRKFDGEYRWFLFRAAPLRDENGNILKWYGTSTDIEDRKEAEETRTAQALRAGVRADVSAALSRTANSGEILHGAAEAIVRHLDAAFARIWTLNKEKNALELQASAGMYTHLDGPHSRIQIGKMKVGLIAQDKKPHLTNDVLNDPLISDKDWAQNEGMVSFAGYPLVVQERVVGVMAMFARHQLSAATLDTLASISDSIAQGIERKQTEERIRQSEAFLAEAQRISLTGSFGWNVSSGELFWSDETYRIVGVDKASKPALETIFQRIHPEDIARVQNTLERAVRDGADLDFEHRFLMPGGSIKCIHVLAHAVRDKSGNLEYVGSAMDITATRRAEEALREAQANLAHVSRVTTVGELTASIAHEINQPLTAVVNNANACLGLLPTPAPHLQEVRDALTEIIDDVDRASAIIARIRQLTRKAPIEKVLLDLRNVITDVSALARYESSARRVTIRTELPGEQLPVLGDRVQLQQVLLNLVVNGMDAMNTVEESKRVLIIRGHREIRDGMPELGLGVQDAGIGFKPEQADRLFEAFYTTKLRGMGMGLAISRSIIEAHGGRLWAEANQGPGATFLFSLPEAGHTAL